MNFLEKDLEDIIFETPNETLQNRELVISGRKLRQVRIGNYGMADLITYERQEKWDASGQRDLPYLDVTVFELKKDNINDNTFWQGIRYLRGIDRYLKYRSVSNYQLNLTLIGKDICPNSTFVYMPCFFDGAFQIYTYDFRIDGLYFDLEDGYKLIHEGWGDEQ